MNRGARRAAIFGEPWMAALFVDVLGDLPERLGIEILAYAVMPNHFHLLVRCPDAQLSRALKHLGAEFTQRLNRTRAWDGPVFRGRFKSRVVEDEPYLAHLFAYIHLNPVRAGLAQSADAATWTSHRALVGLARCPGWLEPNGLLASHGTIDAYRGYLADSLAGVRPAPAGWDPEHLWARVEVEQRPALPAVVDVAALLAQVAEVTGVPVERLVAAGGRGGNARGLAAWWLARRTRARNLEVGGWLGCSGPRVSQLRGLAAGDDAPFGAWKAALTAQGRAADVQMARESPQAAYAA